jgi:hypothetical protein
VIDPGCLVGGAKGADVGIAFVHAFCDTEGIGMPAAAISAVQALTDFVQTCYGVPAIQTRILISCLLPTGYPPVWMLIQSERNRFLNDLAFVFIRLNSFDLTDTVHFRCERPRFHNILIKVVLAERDQRTVLFVDRYWQLPGPRLWRTSRYPLLAQECVRMRLTFDPGRFPGDMVRDQLYEHVCQALGAALGDRGGIVPARPDEDLERRITAPDAAVEFPSKGSEACSNSGKDRYADR